MFLMEGAREPGENPGRHRGSTQTLPSPPLSGDGVCQMQISGKKKQKKNTPTRKQTCQDVSAQRGVLERLQMKSCLHTQTSITHHHQQLHLHLPPRSRGCRSEKLNFSDEEVVFFSPAPVSILPLSPPIHSLILFLIYKLLIYAPGDN